ncbi:General transcription factor IIH subunit 2 [Phytophthora cinnamomi]|uniref:General transcription factor IIH subunit 2 n=1 Tax=Phytophthora cinnamomi TaxID=4785 RepID=UPI003559ED64|nr:General transcription factor IIH subunit 2 [Phytophthora cinnamomi]
MGSAASTSSNGEGGKPRAVIVCHSSQESALGALLTAAGGGGEVINVDNVIIVTESYPHDRQHRAEVISRAQAAFVAIDPMLQRSSVLIETLSYLKDQRKTVISGPLTFFSRPSGAIGAVCLALSQWDLLLFADSERFAYWADKYELLTRSEADTIVDDNKHLDSVEAPATASSPQIFFVYCKDGEGDADRIVDQFAHNNGAPGEVSLSGEVVRCQHNLESDLVALRAANVVVFVITEACAGNDDGARSFRQLFEHALAWRKPLLPIKEQRASLGGWLALAMAGRLWYQVDAANLELVETPYANIPDCPCKVKDSCLATDFVVCANGLLAMPQRTLERPQIASSEEATMRIAKERAQVLGLSVDTLESLCRRVEELVNSTSSGDDCESKSLAELRDALGIATTKEAVETEATDPLDQPKPEELLPEEKTEESKSLQPLSSIHYEVTRMIFDPPPAVLDINGLPIVGLQLDAMFSYQWGSQRTVLDIHQQGQVFNLRAWFDVYGHMQGNVNSAMAAAVESVACMVVFLTKAYLASVNCHLEFAYAARCRKPMIFAFLEDPATLELPEWISEVAGTTQFNVYPSLIRETADEPSRVLALNMNADRVRGVPMTDALFGAIRRLAAWRTNAPLPIMYDGSLLLYATTSALHHAIAGTAPGCEGEENRPKPKLCTRCGAAFSPDIPDSLEGCRRHTAYYVGGTLIAGRWVCCQETRTDGPGCSPAQHMTVQRMWKRDPSYGTYTYEPNS